MTTSAGARISLAVCAVILAVAALHLARSILAPVTFALFIIALVWPLQRALQERMPRLLAMAVSVLVTVLVVTLLSSLVVWGFGRAAQWLFANGARFQAFYADAAAWLESHDLYVASLFTDHFNMSWLIRIVQQISARLHNILTFSALTLIFVVLGLLEVQSTRHKLESLRNAGVGEALLRASQDIAAKFQRYMVIRTIMSVATGLSVWALARLFGIDLAVEWGVLAFVLNYIPFLGPLFATVFPTFFTAAQFESWQLALSMFLCLNAVQFVLGSYLEPRIAGAALSLSPFMVLFAVFFWAFLWGVPGAFIGVPILIAAVTLFDQHASLKPLALLLAGDTAATAPTIRRRTSR